MIWDKIKNTPAKSCMNRINVIRTKRFVLKPLFPRHASQKYLAWLKDPVSCRYISAAKKTKKIKDLRKYIKHFSRQPDCIFLRILTKKINSHIGNIKYHPIDKIKKTAVMGILIGDISWRGQGAASEVIKKTSLWLKNRLGIKKIILGVERSNQNAIKAYRKAGFYFSKKKALNFRAKLMIKKLL